MVLSDKDLGSEITGRVDYVVQYAHSAIRPAANYVPRLSLRD
jgi:hypothetical protein